MGADPLAAAPGSGCALLGADSPALGADRPAAAPAGAWLDSPDAFVTENMGSLGWDWLVVDLQHGLLDYSDSERASFRCLLPLFRC